ncbi:uncharacterized protein [Malus domestica]|uniref:uncharacterized protein isoform X2 n=1 Tax=Malus domestica TaxID=3750 RepID=UPI0010AADDA0|nr:uncharacterized protein LOC103433109 isoform X2 [Malus domestica]
MAETSAALCFSPFTSLFSFIRAKDSSFSSFSTDFPPKSPNSHPCPSRLLRFPAKSSSDSSNSLPDDLFGFFPWSNDSEKIEWVPEERVTLFTSDGLIQIGGSMVPRRLTSSNGLDTGRRLCIFGFCRSIEMLSDVVEDTVLEHGGEVVAAEKAMKGGLQEKLRMTVAVPLLWGVPPAAETLHLAVKSGGGIVDKVYWQWDFL